MRRRAALSLALVAAVWIAAPAGPEGTQATTLADIIRPVDVTISDRGITVEADLGREEFVRGSIGELRVVNQSSARRNFVMGVERTPVLDPGERATIEVEFPVRGPVPYRVNVNRRSGHTGMIRVF